jgi:protein gp37
LSQSKIEWTESTWNPVSGCTKISNGCDNCYAERHGKKTSSYGYERAAFNARKFTKSREKREEYRKRAEETQLEYLGICKED